MVWLSLGLPSGAECTCDYALKRCSGHAKDEGRERATAHTRYGRITAGLRSPVPAHLEPVWLPLLLAKTPFLAQLHDGDSVYCSVWGRRYIIRWSTPESRLSNFVLCVRMFLDVCVCHMCIRMQLLRPLSLSSFTLTKAPLLPLQVTLEFIGQSSRILHVTRSMAALQGVLVLCAVVRLLHV